MRVLLLLSVLVLLISFCVAVPVKYTLCSKPEASLKISTVEANEWPPKKGTTLNVTVTGVLGKEVTKGTYTIKIKVSGFPLPAENGDVDTFKPLPWMTGDISFTFLTDIPAESPSGSYSIEISAVDQDNAQIFCVDLSFNLAAVSTPDQITHQKVQMLKQKSLSQSMRSLVNKHLGPRLLKNN